MTHETIFDQLQKTDKGKAFIRQMIKKYYNVSMFSEFKDDEVQEALWAARVIHYNTYWIEEGMKSLFNKIKVCDVDIVDADTIRELRGLPPIED